VLYFEHKINAIHICHYISNYDAKLDLRCFSDGYETTRENTLETFEVGKDGEVVLKAVCILDC
jgi:hypothetical protein